MRVDGSSARSPDELLTAARTGDRAALEQLLASQQARIYAFGMRMCRDPEDARDVLQETMLSVARNVEGFRADASLSTWLFSIARSFCIKKRRRKKGAPLSTEPLDAAAHAAAPGPTAEDVASAHEQRDALQEALQSLPAASREVLVLRDVEGLSAPEVAAVLGTSVDAVKSRLHRARAALEAALVPAAAGADAAPGCPDILALFSRNLEGELTSDTCATMEKHLATCPRCRGACDALKSTLALCQLHPEVPAHVSRTVKAAVRELLALPAAGPLPARPAPRPR